MNTTPPLTTAVDIAKGIPKGGLGVVTTGIKAKLYTGLVAPIQGAWHIIKGVPANLLDKAINQGYDMANSARAGYRTFAVGPKYLKRIPGLVGGALGLGGGTVLYGVSNAIDAGADMARSGYDMGLARAELVKSTYYTAKDTATLFADQRDLRTITFLQNSGSRFLEATKYGFKQNSSKRKGFRRLKNSFRKGDTAHRDAIIMPIRPGEDNNLIPDKKPNPEFFDAKPNSPPQKDETTNENIKELPKRENPKFADAA